MSRASSPAPLAKADRARVQRSSVGVALWVGLASVVLLGAVTATVVGLIVAVSRPDRRPGRGGRPFDDRVVGVADIVPLVIALGVLAIVALSLIAWYASRRAALPLAEALRVQRSFVADASHELRTPLTTLTSRIQLAQHRMANGGDVASVLSDLRRDADVLDDVLTDLLHASETAGSRVGDKGTVSSVARAAAAAAETLELPASAKGVRIIMEIPDGLDVAAESAALVRALVALMDNAVRHSPVAGTVRLTARRAGRHAELRVIDEGAGIRGIDVDRVFERFVRADDGATRTGFGLGLALVRDIASRFGGTVSVETTSAAGTTFLLVLPVR